MTTLKIQNEPTAPPAIILYPLPGLPGTLTLAPGKVADYRALARFHYRPKPPATWAAIWTVTYTPINELQNEPKSPPPHSKIRNFKYFKSEIRIPPNRPVAVAVLSWPVLNLPIRNKLLRLNDLSPTNRITFLNQNVRTISRVAVHPQFRSLGLAVTLVNCICNNCSTRYIDALATMARAHRFFDLAGMMRHDPKADDPDRPVYFLFDRRSALPKMPRTNPPPPIAPKAQQKHRAQPNHQPALRQDKKAPPLRRPSHLPQLCSNEHALIAVKPNSFKLLFRRKINRSADSL